MMWGAGLHVRHTPCPHPRVPLHERGWAKDHHTVIWWHWIILGTLCIIKFHESPRLNHWSGGCDPVQNWFEPVKAWMWWQTFSDGLIWSGAGLHTPTAVWFRPKHRLGNRFLNFCLSKYYFSVQRFLKITPLECFDTANNYLPFFYFYFLIATICNIVSNSLSTT